MTSLIEQLNNLNTQIENNITNPTPGIDVNELRKKRDEIKNMFKDAIVIINVDRSGSMNSIYQSTYEALVKFVREQESVGDSENTKFILNTFDNIVESPLHDISIKNASDSITMEQIEPRGGTALYDAIIKSIEMVQTKEYKYTNIIIMTMTDGLDNDSRSTANEVKATIESVSKDSYNIWNFILLAANQDAIELGSRLGIKKENSLTYYANPQYVQTAMSHVSASAVRYRSMEASPQSQGFTPAQRSSSLPTGGGI